MLNTRHIYASLTLALAAVCMASPALAATKAFKCTAEDGSIRYLDTKPSTGCVKVEEVLVSVNRGSSDEPPADATNPDKTAADAGKPGDKNNANNQDRAEQIKERQEQTKQACEGTRKNLEVLQTRTHILVDDGKGGKKAMSSEEHQDALEKAQQFLKDFCN